MTDSHEDRPRCVSSGVGRHGPSSSRCDPLRPVRSCHRAPVCRDVTDHTTCAAVVAVRYCNTRTLLRRQTFHIRTISFSPGVLDQVDTRRRVVAVRTCNTHTLLRRQTFHIPTTRLPGRARSSRYETARGCC